jgi:hypothetical protein
MQTNRRQVADAALKSQENLEDGDGVASNAGFASTIAFEDMLRRMAPTTP